MKGLDKKFQKLWGYEHKSSSLAGPCQSQKETLEKIKAHWRVGPGMIASDLLTETDKRKLLNYFEKAESHRSVSKKRSRQYPANKLSFNKDELIKGGITFPGNYFQV